jgi:hypothetical protein
MITLYKFNRITGYWVAVRQCDEDTAREWLRVFEQDEPEEYFYLSRRTPKHNPVYKYLQWLD